MFSAFLFEAFSNAVHLIIDILLLPGQLGVYVSKLLGSSIFLFIVLNAVNNTFTLEFGIGIFELIICRGQRFTFAAR